MQEKTRLGIIAVLVCLLAASSFVGLRVYTSRKAIESESRILRAKNEDLSRSIDEISKERSKLQEKVNALTKDLGKTFQEKEDIRRQYALMAKERDELVNSVMSLKKDNEQLHADLTDLSQEKQRLEEEMKTNLTNLANLASVKDENAQLKQQLGELGGFKVKLEVELAELKGEKSDLEQKLNQLDSFVGQKLTQERLDAIRSGGGVPKQETVKSKPPEKESIELPPIVVMSQEAALKPEVAAAAPRPKEITTAVKPKGEVLEVNRENKFVVINLGQEEGIKLKDSLKAYRQDKSIATIEVIRVRQHISACDIKKEIMPIEAGDTVR